MSVLKHLDNHCCSGLGRTAEQWQLSKAALMSTFIPMTVYLFFYASAFISWTVDRLQRRHAVILEENDCSKQLCKAQYLHHYLDVGVLCLFLVSGK